MLSFFPRGVLEEILNLIESVSEGFPSYYYNYTVIRWKTRLTSLQAIDNKDAVQSEQLVSENTSIYDKAVKYALSLKQEG